MIKRLLALLLLVLFSLQVVYATDITLTQAQIGSVLADHCDCIEPPPIDPPVDPDPDPDPDPPPVQPPGDLYGLFFSDVWGVRLTTDKGFYGNEYVYNRSADGTSVAIRIPTLTGVYKFKLTDIETVGTGGVRREGVLSWRRDFNTPYIDYRIWGIGGGVVAMLSPSDSGRTLYFNHRIMPQDGPYAPWWSTLTATFRRQ